MKIHLVGGFLGSGKTTAIANAAKQLLGQNVTTSVVTNDQGKYLVDSKFIRLSEITNVEVTGGCFCCNYDQLDSQIDVLKKDVKPSVIFAESVGSCTDLIATVVKPMTKYRAADVELVTFSGFVDSRMLLHYLHGNRLPFTSETNYIWQKQLDEAEILIVNKVDLLDPEEISALRNLAVQHFPTKTLLFQNSLDKTSIQLWLDVLDAFRPGDERLVIDVDYATYGAGEAHLAWLDEEIEITSTTRTAVGNALSFIDDVTSSIEKLQLPIGHLKFFLLTPNDSAKISFTTVMGASWKNSVSLQESDTVDLMVNARIQSSPEQLRAIIADAVERLTADSTARVQEKNISCFQPGFPNPTHRFTE